MFVSKGKIQDNLGRTLILRGVNLGGSSKNPFGPPGWSFSPESLKNPENASFIGRPFPLEDAEFHFKRLNRAGFTFLRLIVTWEALEHAGPGQYDEAFLAYLRKILIIAEKWNISVFIDPHQDVWSRWTGGDGAPAWTLEKIGIDLEKLDASDSAVTRQNYAALHGGAPYPRMIWPSNYNRYAAATMFSLFFGGKTYAPDLHIEGENVQEWLQNRYFAAFRHCYRRLKNCAAVAGWGIMNEPHNGYIGCKNLEQAGSPVMPIGPRPSPWDGIRAASGNTVAVPLYNSYGLNSRKHVFFNNYDNRAVTLFKEGFCCPWKQAGVWTEEHGTALLISKAHFSLFNGRQVNFMEDCYKPFILRFIETIKELNENAFFFIEGIPSGMGSESRLAWNKEDPPNTVNAFHWYDGLTLFTKQFRSWFTVDPVTKKIIIGKKKIQAYFIRCVARAKNWLHDHVSENINEHSAGRPALLGEFGLAFDMNKRKAFKNGDYSRHIQALDMYYNAVDAHLLHSTVWNYTADNSNAYGDGWNDEDLSIFSEGKERAAAGWKRPYPMATAGEPLLIDWNLKKKVFKYRFNADGAIGDPTIIYLPMEFFGPKASIACSLRFEFLHKEQRLLVFNDGASGEKEIQVSGFAALN